MSKKNKNLPILIVAGAAVFLLSTSSKGSDLPTPTPSNNNVNWGNNSQPRGIRNNNPMNLIYTNIQWIGKKPYSENKDFSGTPTNIVKHFEQFYEPKYGIRAGIKDIKHDIQIKGKNTIEALIYEFAPPFENNTENYINNLSQMAGISRNSILTANKETLKKLSQAIANIENFGIKPLDFTISNELFNSAYALI